MTLRRLLSLLMSLSLLVPSLAQASGDATGMHSRAVSFYQTGRLEKALALYQHLAEKSPKDPAALKDLLWVLWKTSRYAEAAPVARRLTQLLPKDEESWNFLAQAEEIA